MSTNSLIGGLVGGVAGFFIGGPAGAMIGAGIGMGLGAALTPMPGISQQGPRLSDLKVQTSTYGAAIPRVYGTVGITGNVIWLEGGQLKEVVRRKKVKSGGKGGSKKTTVTTYTYYATLAIGLCEGPIAGVRRIWAGPNLIYDAASDDLETIIASNQNAAGFSIYLGGADQQPDSRIQADRGVANTPAYRGLAYVVIKDFLLTDYGNAIPAFKVEVFSSSALSSELVRQNKRGLSGGVSTGNYAPGLALNGSAQWFYCYAENLNGSNSAYAVTSWQAGNSVKKVEDFREYHSIRGHAVNYGLLAVRISSAETIRYAWRMEGLTGNTAPKWFAVNDGADLLIETSGTTNLVVYEAGGVIYAASGTGSSRAVRRYVDAAEQASATIPNACFCVYGSRLVALSGVSGDHIGVTVYADDMTIDSSFIIDIPADVTFGTLATESAAFCKNGVIYLDTGKNPAQAGKIEILEIGVDDRHLAVHSIPVSISGGVGYLSEFISCTFSNGLFSVARQFDNAVFQASFKINGGNAQAAPLSAVVPAEMLLSGLLEPSEIDATELAGDIAGYRVSGGPLRAALEPLQAVKPFDAIASGYMIRCVPRGKAGVATISVDELGVDEQLPQAREMNSQLPRKMNVQYLDAARNYDGNAQFAERINTESANEVDAELAVVMGASQAVQIAERLLSLAWLERVGFGPFQLPPLYRRLEPSDVITIDAGYAQYELRLTEVSYNADGTLTCSGLPNNAAVYVSQAASDEVPSEQTIGLGGESLFIPLDIPVIDETIQDSAGFVGAMTGYTGGWPGAVAVQTVDGGQTWADVQAFDGKASIGYAASSLAENSCTLIDETALRISMVSGELESVTEAQMLAGTNWAAYGADGRWEIVRFRDAALQPDGSYLLSGFKRGDKGTEWATGLHQSGDLFIPLDDGDLAAIGMPVEAIGVASTWRGVTAGDTVDAASDVPFVYRGVNLRPLTPAYPISSRNGSADLVLSWTRRSRLSSSWWATGTAAPLGEASEAYEVDILNGSTVVRTIISSTPSITYTAAQQVADFGSVQASIAARIYQLSAVVGRGYPLQGAY